MYFIVYSGKSLEVGRNIVMPLVKESYFSQFLQTIKYNLTHPVGLVLAQIITIIIISRIFAYLFHKIHQPAVIGEIIAGIALGPSLLGAIFPGFSMALFPDQSLGNLNMLSQIGLVLFMFMVGMELDLSVVKNKVRDAVVVSNAGILIPFALGMGLSYFIYANFAPIGVPFIAFGLFMGLAMSITAFPVLARIVQERGIHKTSLGTLVITCAATDDITAWCLLAAIIAIAKAGTFISSLYILALSVAYVIFMIKVVKPFLKRIGDLHTSRENLSKPVVAIFFLTLLISAYTTETIGIHALFGAFLAGTIMPENSKFRNIFIQKIEDVALVLLLPLFFVFTGLRTQIGLINDIYLLKITGLIILVAITGKLAGSALTARVIGQSWKDSLTIGTLMNTRGLMELVVLNIGYDLGILSPEIFSMMVIMALVTTFMTGPALDFIEKVFKHEKQVYQATPAGDGYFRIILSFGNPEMGRSLLRIANFLVRKQPDKSQVTALHLCPNSVLHHYNIDDYEAESFNPVLQESRHLKLNIETRFKASDNIDNDIKEISNEGGFNLLLIGIGQSIFEGSILGKIIGYTTRMVNPDRLLHKVTDKAKYLRNSPFDNRTINILMGSNIPVGIFVDKNFGTVKKIALFCLSEFDDFMGDYIRRFMQGTDAHVTFIGESEVFSADDDSLRTVLSAEFPDRVDVFRLAETNEKFLKQFQLIVVSTRGWRELVEDGHNWLKQTPSMLIFQE
jgi:Kef-type K+ transport system membrane component KefB